MTDNLSKKLSLLSNQVKTDRLVGLEARVWEAISLEKHSTPLLGAVMMLRAASIALVLLVGGIVGANQKPSDPVLMAFSKAPAYSVMSMLKN